MNEENSACLFKKIKVNRRIKLQNDYVGWRASVETDGFKAHLTSTSTSSLFNEFLVDLMVRSRKFLLFKNKNKTVLCFCRKCPHQKIISTEKCATTCALSSMIARFFRCRFIVNHFIVVTLIIILVIRNQFLI